MEKRPLLSELLIELEELGYTQQIIWNLDKLFYEPKALTILPDDLYFIDAGFLVLNQHIIFAINSPLYDIKAKLELSIEEYKALLSGSYQHRFSIELHPYNAPFTLVGIDRQYDMRKIRKRDFNPLRFELRQGFPDFPPCPFGHEFKALGYDLQEKEYVRFTSSILKDENLKIRKYGSEESSSY